MLTHDLNRLIPHLIVVGYAIRIDIYIQWELRRKVVFTKDVYSPCALVLPHNSCATYHIAIFHLNHLGLVYNFRNNPASCFHITSCTIRYVSYVIVKTFTKL